MFKNMGHNIRSTLKVTKMPYRLQKYPFRLQKWPIRLQKCPIKVTKVPDLGYKSAPSIRLQTCPKCYKNALCRLQKCQLIFPADQQSIFVVNLHVHKHIVS